MQYTANYQLPQWAEDDRIMMGDFNKAMADIDRGLAGVAQDGAAALAQAVGSGGQNCRIAWGTYSGKGKYGENNSNSLEFGFSPVLVMVGCANHYNKAAWPTIMIRGVGAACADTSTAMSDMSVQWQNAGVKWWNNYSEENQNNSAGTAYYYIAVGYTK